MIAEVQHPDLLNPWQTYRQARQLLKHTSRASQPDWYREAIDIDRQWHVWIDGGIVVSAVFDKKNGRWFEGPDLPVPTEKDELGNPDYTVDERRALHETLNGAMLDKNFGGKAKALGFVVHVANEFDVSDIAPEFAADEDFREVNELLAVAPGEALGDPNVEGAGHARRLLPYWGVREGERKSTAVVLSRALQVITDEATSYGEVRNIPIVAAAISAPLVALSLTPMFLDPSDNSTEGHLFIFNYRKFTALAVLDAQGDLILCRSLPHASGRNYATGLGDTIVKTAALVNLTDPHVHIIPMSDIDVEPLVGEMSGYFASHAPMNIGFVDPSEVEALRGIPGGRAEMAIGNRKNLEQLFQTVKIGQTESLVELRSNWASQNFFGPTEEQKTAEPSQKDLKMLKVFGLVKVLMILGLVGLFGWTGFEWVTALASESWRLGQESTEMTEKQLADLQSENKSINHWENLMAKRSEGWLVMETMLELFPGPDSGMVVTSANYQISGIAPGRKKGRTVGFKRLWTIEGYALPSKVTELAQLGSTSYIESRFKAVAERTEASSLEMNSETRNLTAMMQQRQGQMPASQQFSNRIASQFTTFFQLSIQQDFSEKDEMALGVKVPTDESAP